MTATITPADVLDGLLPAEASGVYFREYGLLLCREHLNVDTIGHLDDYPGVVQYGFIGCDACTERDHEAPWLNVDAVVPAILRDDVPELVRAADRMLEAVAGFVRLVPALRDIERAISVADLPDDVATAVERTIGLEAMRTRTETAGFLLNAIGAVIDNPSAVRVDELDGEVLEVVAAVVADLRAGAREYLVGGER